MADLQERSIAVPSMVTIKGGKYLHIAITNHHSRRGDVDRLVREVVWTGKELSAGGEVFCFELTLVLIE